MEALESLPILLKFFCYIAIPTSLIFLIQTVITFSGHDLADDFDIDFDAPAHDGDNFQLFSLRNLINFLLGFSWTGISFYYKIGKHTWFLIPLSLFVGIVSVILFFFMTNQIQKLGEGNSFKITDTLNKTAQVYLKIPGKKKGKGKIMISVKGVFHELDAMTENGKIPSGRTVKVIKIENNILLVKVLDSGNAQGENGNSSTANFVSGMMKTVSPLNNLFNMANLNLPTNLKGGDPQEVASTIQVEETKE